MASLSGASAPHEVSLFIDFRPVWDADIRVWDGDIPLDNQRPNAHWQGRIPDVDSSKRSPDAPPHHDCSVHFLWICNLLDGSE